MEPEGSLPCLQELAIGPCTEPDESRPYLQTVLMYRLIHPSIYDYQGSRVQTRTRRWIFKGDKNQQHAFFRRESKVVGPVS
jgi:hypothetical protein